jgi:hypothetical protein
MKTSDKTNALFQSLVKKGTLKQQVHQNTLKAMGTMKKAMIRLTEHYELLENGASEAIPFVYKDRSQFEAELKFAGDVLVFMMHTNVFEFPRDHEVMKTQYIHKDKERSYCGIINIFNFLSDSFKYNRMNDSGYLVGRVFVNKENHCFVEGKREIGFAYKDFGHSIMDEERAIEIVESSISYTINFDLLTPPYDQIKIVSVSEFSSALDSMRIKTGKRLGFKFQADVD